MTRVSSVGEYFKIVQSRNGCEVAEGYMSCYNETRIYDEENDCGYTVKQIDALKYSQVFDEDGSPKKLNLVDPSDAQDLRQVFWLRNAPSESGANNFVPIDYLGDIDPAFMPADAVVRHALLLLSIFLIIRKKGKLGAHCDCLGLPGGRRARAHRGCAGSWKRGDQSPGQRAADGCRSDP